jgi:outer membrane protein assembly factor BamB
MLKRTVKLSILLVLLAAALAAQTPTTPSAASTTDWPQWRGPDRNGVSKETGLLKQWPQAGPPRLWRVTNLGPGYGSLAVKGDRIYVQMMTGRQSSVASLNRANGQIVWSRAIGAAETNDRGNGPRGTPTIDGDYLYALTENGDLACLKLADGTPVWQVSLLREMKGRNINWLFSESPLINGSHVIVSPGGRDATVAALDKMTGKTVWTTKGLSDEPGYASVIAADVQGVRTLMTFTSTAAVGIRATDGKVMWKYEQAANGTANIATPVFSDNKVFFSSDYGTGAALLGLTVQAGEVKARELYFTRNMKNHHGGLVLVNGTLYGFDSSILTALDFQTGMVRWRDRSVGKGSLTYADGHLYVLGEKNVMGWVEASPTGYREKGRFTIPDSGFDSWAHPVVSNGRLYIRDQGSLTAYDIKAK